MRPGPAPLRLAARRRRRRRGRGRDRAAAAARRGDRRRRRRRARRAALPARRRAARDDRPARRPRDDPGRAAGAADPRLAPATRGRPRSSRPRTSSSGSASRPSGRRSSSPPGSPAGPGRRTVESLVTPEFALRFRGEVVVHDAEDPGPRRARLAAGTSRSASTARSSRPTRSSPSAPRETVLHGGPASLLAAVGARTTRAGRLGRLAARDPLGARAGTSRVALERALARRVPLIGASLTLDLPRLSGALRGYPYEPAAVDADRRARGSHARSGSCRRRCACAILASLSLELTASAAFAGPPSVAHAEALVRSVETRVSAALDEPLDALCIGIPRTTLVPPARAAERARRGRARPRLRAPALARRVPGARGRHGDPRHARSGAGSPTRRSSRTARSSRRPGRAASRRRSPRPSARPPPTRARSSAYRGGRTCHPRLPFADWDACRPALDRLGAVLVAGCRDAAAARQLGFVPTHGVSAALEMARGLGGEGHRVGFLLSPPVLPGPRVGVTTPRRGRSCGPARSRAAPSRRRRARSCRSRARSRGRRRRAPSARSARRAGSACPAC